MTDPKPAVDVLYIDHHLLALNKPAGLLTQPSGTARSSLETDAKAWIKEHENKPGNVYLHAVHRLDAPVSGIVLFARSSKALSRLNQAIRERSTHKTYLALVSRPPKQEEQTLEHFLVQDHQLAKVVTKNTPGALSARLSYRVLKRIGTLTLLELHPETGRYHQIRAQLSAIGCPILGDRRYGGEPWPNPGIALHHSRLELLHPVGQQPLIIDASLPWA
jgi:23S rRNA pseudouridine1911/1915/1917 synthase